MGKLEIILSRCVLGAIWMMAILSLIDLLKIYIAIRYVWLLVNSGGDTNIAWAFYFVDTMRGLLIGACIAIGVISAMKRHLNWKRHVVVLGVVVVLSIIMIATWGTIYQTIKEIVGYVGFVGECKFYSLCRDAIDGLSEIIEQLRDQHCSGQFCYDVCAHLNTWLQEAHDGLSDEILARGCVDFHFSVTLIKMWFARAFNCYITATVFATASVVVSLIMMREPHASTPSYESVPLTGVETKK